MRKNLKLIFMRSRTRERSTTRLRLLRKAWLAWAHAPIKERPEIVRQFKLLERGCEIPDVEVSDSGNTIKLMRADVGHAVDSLNYCASIELEGETMPATPNELHITLREPRGVVGPIVPSNHPRMLLVARTAAASASGNALIVTPPETSPQPALSPLLRTR
jgi:acyl-CoA reductase-like NAD-dependent aldehyde dehydrogenase